MRKWYLAVLITLLVPSLCLAGERIMSGSGGGKSAKSFADTDLSFERAHVCNFDPDANFFCDIPEKLIVGTVTYHITIFAPIGQGYLRIYVVSDTAGTVVDLQTTSGFLPSGLQTLVIDQLLPPGDYTFTSLVLGDDGRTAVSDQYRFGVR